MNHFAIISSNLEVLGSISTWQNNPPPPLEDSWLLEVGEPLLNPGDWLYSGGHLLLKPGVSQSTVIYRGPHQADNTMEQTNG